MANKSELTTILSSMRSLPMSPFTDPDSVDVVINQYVDDLGDIEYPILKAAAQHYRTSANPFFPTSGQLREKATDLLLLSMGVPTAAEAWANVLDAEQYKPREYCQTGYDMRESYNSTNGNLVAYIRHESECEICGKVGGFVEVYQHPVVSRVVQMLGGRKNLLTDNLAADRSQFIRAYNEIVTRETKKMSLPEPVKEAVGFIASGQIKALADGMKKS